MHEQRHLLYMYIYNCLFKVFSFNYNWIFGALLQANKLRCIYLTTEVFLLHGVIRSNLGQKRINIYFTYVYLQGYAKDKTEQSIFNFLHKLNLQVHPAAAMQRLRAILWRVKNRLVAAVTIYTFRVISLGNKVVKGILILFPVE